MPRPSRRVALWLIVALAAGACSSRPTPNAIPTTTTSVAPTSTATSRAPTTTTKPLPPNPQPSADAAATVFMQGWMAANRSQSASVATEPAVAALFATPYAQQPLNDRGCSDAFPPYTCTWGPYAGGSGNLYQITLTPTSGGRWYVSGVVVET